MVSTSQVTQRAFAVSSRHCTTGHMAGQWRATSYFSGANELASEDWATSRAPIFVAPIAGSANVGAASTFGFVPAAADQGFPVADFGTRKHTDPPRPAPVT